MSKFGVWYFGEGDLDGRFQVLFNGDFSDCKCRFDICLEEADTVVELNVTERISFQRLCDTVQWLDELVSGKNDQTLAGIGWGRMEFLIQDEQMPTVDLIIYLQEAEEYDGSGMYLRIELYPNVLEALLDYLRKVHRTIWNQRSEFDCKMIELAHEFADRQYDYYCHMDADYPPGYLLRQLVLIKKDGYETMNPWIPQNQTIIAEDIGDACCRDDKSGFDPFLIYGKKKIDAFIKRILEKNGIDTTGCLRSERVKEIRAFYKAMELCLPTGFPDAMSNEELKEMLESLDEFDPWGVN